MVQQRQGGCLCGAARYEINLQGQRTGLCHCRDCQRHLGAPFGCFTTVDQYYFKWLSMPSGAYLSTETGALRRYCTDCGGSLTWESVKHPDTMTINTISLDDSSGLVPNYEIYTQNRMVGLQPVQGAKQIEKHWISNN